MSSFGVKIGIQLPVLCACARNFNAKNRPKWGTSSGCSFETLRDTIDTWNFDCYGKEDPNGRKDLGHAHFVGRIGPISIK